MFEVQKPQIILQPKREVYHPGDQISGVVRATLNKDFPLGKIYVRLIGQENTTITEGSGEDCSYYHERTNLFYIEDIVHREQFDRKAGDYEFPFELTLPKLYERRSTPKWEAGDGFLASANATELRELPPSVWSDGGGYLAAFIMYYVEAEIVPHGELSPWRIRKRTEELINVQPQPSGPSIDSSDRRHDLTTWSRRTIKTFRLLPRSADRLSFKQKALQTIRSPQVPTFTFYLLFSHPTVLQQQHKNAFPFVLKARVHSDTGITPVPPGSSNIPRYPDITIKSFKLKLVRVTVGRVQQGNRQRATSKKSTWINREFTDLKLRICPRASDQCVENECATPTSIDFAVECGPSINSVAPTFKSYQIYRYYHLSWKIKMECAGEEITIKDQNPKQVTILGPAAQ